MIRWFASLLLVVALAACAAGGYLWGNALTNSVYGYRSPLRTQPSRTDEHNSAIVQHVVLVIVDGLRYDISFQMPFLNGLRKSSAHARLVTRPFTSAPAAWTTLLSGAWPEINDAPAFDIRLDQLRPMAVDNLVASCQRSGLTTGIAAGPAWSRLLARDGWHLSFFAAAQGPNQDGSIGERASRFVEEFAPSLLIVHLSALDQVAHQYGGVSEQYLQSAQDCDRLIRTLLESVDLNDSIFVVTSGFGHLDEGGRGGAEPALLSTPLVMTGSAVLTGDRGIVKAADLAPTLATALGVPVPSIAQGTIRFDLIQISDPQEAQALVGLADQRVRLARLYLQSIGRGSISEAALGDATVARSSLQVRNYASAAELALLSVEQADRQMAQERSARQEQATARRIALVAAAAVIPLLVVWKARSRALMCSLLASAASVGLYHLLYVRSGGAYSFSRVTELGLGSTLASSAQNAVVGLGAGALLVLLCARQERTVSGMALRALVYVVLQVGMVAAAAGICAVLVGTRLSWYIPDLPTVFILLSLIVQATLIAVLGLCLPIPLVLAHQTALLVHRAVGHWRK